MLTHCGRQGKLTDISRAGHYSSEDLELDSLSSSSRFLSHLDTTSLFSLVFSHFKLTIMILFWLFSLATLSLSRGQLQENVSDLSVQPGLRSVKLKWTYADKAGLVGFKIRHCELSTWQSKMRCKETMAPIKRGSLRAPLDYDDAIVALQRLGSEQYLCSIDNLRMLTNYSFSVKAQFGHLRESSVQVFLTKHDIDLDQTAVFAETKSFSAKTSRCLANSSEIEVTTGPYFSGKISVEGSNNAACTIFGNKTSANNTYIFRIDHNQCGSSNSNNSRIETMVVVNENKEILTHNSRRYLVVCTFAPETYTLTASVAVPNHLIRKLYEKLREKQVYLSATNRLSEKQRVARSGQQFGANLHDSRLLAQVVPDQVLKSMPVPHSPSNAFFPSDKLLIGVGGLLLCTLSVLLYAHRIQSHQRSDAN